MTIELYQTPQAGELIDRIRVTGASNGVIQPYQRAVMFSLQLLNIKAGDIIDLKAYGQVSNPFEIVLFSRVVACEILRPLGSWIVSPL